MAYEYKLTTSASELKYPGVYLRVIGPGVECIVPYHATSIGHSTAHELSQPVSDIYEWLKGNASDVAGSLEQAFLGTSVFKEAAEAAYKLSDIFGLKLYNRKFFANAWKGTRPSEANIMIELKTGWRGDYSGKSEVYDPIKHMYKGVVPGESAVLGFITSPGPTIASVAGEFIKQYIDKAAGKVKELIDNASNTKVQGKETQKTKDGGKGIWQLTLFTALQEEGGGMKGIRILDLRSLVCRSAAISMDTTVDTEGYPIKGSINLSFVSSDITTDSVLEDLLPGPTDL